MTALVGDLVVSRVGVTESTDELGKGGVGWVGGGVHGRDEDARKSVPDSEKQLVIWHIYTTTNDSFRSSTVSDVGAMSCSKKGKDVIDVTHVMNGEAVSGCTFDTPLCDMLAHKIGEFRSIRTSLITNPSIPGSLLFCPNCGTLLNLPQGDEQSVTCEQCQHEEPASCMSFRSCHPSLVTFCHLSL